MEGQHIPDDLKTGRIRLASVITLGHAVKHIYNSGLLKILLPEIKVSMKLNGAQYGLLVAARQATSWGTTILSGYLSDRFVNKSAIILGFSLGLLGLAFYIAGNAPNYMGMLGAMLLAGFSPSLFHPPAIGTLSRHFPDRRGFAISLHGTGGIAGEVIGPIVVALLLGIMGWRGILQIGLFPALVAGILTWATVRTISQKTEEILSIKHYFLSIVKMFKNTSMILLVILTALRSMSDTAVGGFLPVYLREDLEFSYFRMAFYLALSHVAGLIAQPVMGFLSDKFGRKSILLPGMAANAITTYGLSLFKSGPLLAITVIASGAFSFSLHHIIIASAIDAVQGQIQSTVVSLIYGAGFLGTFSPYVAGLMVDSFGTRSAFLYAGSIALLATIMLIPVKLPKTIQQTK